MDNNIIHLALSPWDLSDDYNRHAGVTLVSFLSHCSSPVIVHLLYDANLDLNNIDNTLENKKCYQEIADRFDAKIIYHHVNVPDWINSETLPATKLFTIGTLLRLYITDLLPEVDKVIYLDCDVVVNTDIDVLWNIDINNYHLAACQDKILSSVMSSKTLELCSSVSMNPNNYFNAGVLLLNLNKIRDTLSLSNDGFNYLKNHPDTPNLDQDVLNYYFGNSYYHLDEKYNRMLSSKLGNTDNIADSIIHYAGSNKPWKSYNSISDELYWYYLSLTPWSDNGKIVKYIFDIIGKMPDYNEISYEIDKWIWSYSLNKKIKTCWKLTIPLWYKLCLRYFKKFR